MLSSGFPQLNPAVAGAFDAGVLHAADRRHLSTFKVTDCVVWIVQVYAPCEAGVSFVCLNQTHRLSSCQLDVKTVAWIDVVSGSHIR